MIAIAFPPRRDARSHRRRRRGHHVFRTRAASRPPGPRTGLRTGNACIRRAVRPRAPGQGDRIRGGRESASIPARSSSATSAARPFSTIARSATAVNTASRLEGANKHLGTTICLSAATLAGCAPGTVTRPIGRLLLKGKQEALMVYEPLSPDHPGTYAPNAEYCNAYALITSHGDEPNTKASALDAFRNLAEHFPDDPLVALHLGRPGKQFVQRPDRAAREVAPPRLSKAFLPYFPPSRALHDPARPDPLVGDERRPKLRNSRHLLRISRMHKPGLSLRRCHAIHS